MNNRTQCQMCGGFFYPDYAWKTLCIPCFKKSKRLENASELAELREENYRLKYQLTFAKPAVCSIPPVMLNQLIRLAHPDRHGNSQAANAATAWLLAQRCNSQLTGDTL